MTARDVLVGLLGEARADEVIETAARAEYAVAEGDDDWEQGGGAFRDLYYRIPVTAALAGVLPGLLAPEVITTREEADALPDGVVVLDSHRAGRNDTRVSLAAPD